ncbi:MAG: SusC/RagA family TonB-linked outer membrane protein [Prevotella sp.]|nr:SusC/RagA family TonB-linked outer membrane protein [Prevotella sp.]
MRSILSLLLFLVSCTLSAQDNGNIVTGNVEDEFGPVIGVQVCEMDKNDRIIEATTTDMNGNFSLLVKNTKDKIRFSYVGYKTDTRPIDDNKTFKVMLKNNTTLNEVVVRGKTRVATGGLDIPDHEQSFAQQTISMKEFQGLSFTSVDEALQGRIAGLGIINNSGNLGSGTTMRLRGVSTIYGNAEPLIVVDGNIFETDANDDIDYSSLTDEKFSELLSINPEDIESISVLKDAAATAIWGSRGSNGVISIVTKRGTRGKPRISYNLRLKGTYQPKGLSMLNGDQYTMLMKEELFNTTQSPDSQPMLDYDPNYADYQQYNDNTDWRSAVTQFGLFQTHNLSISGGGEKANYRVSMGYDHQIGSVIAQRLDRLSMRMALDYFVSERIKISNNFSLTYTDNQMNSDNLLGIAYQKMPNLAIYDQDAYGNSLGTYYKMPKFQQSYSGDVDEFASQRNLVNPVASAYLAKREARNYSMVPQFDFLYRLLGTDDSRTQLNYTGTVVLSVLNNYNDSYYPWELTSVDWRQNEGGVNSSTSAFDKSLGFMTRHRLVFIPKPKSANHALRFLLQGEVNTGTSSAQNISSYLLPSGTITSASSGGYLNATGTGAGHWRSASWIFQAHYAYKEKYALDFSVRGDGSTRFGPSHRWGHFYSASARWNMTDEKFMQPFKSWLDLLAVRFGWGITGSQPGAGDTYYSIYSTDGKYINTIGTRPTNIRLTDLRWEKQSSWNLGFNVGLFHDLLTADINVYSQLKSDLLMRSPRIPSTSGFSTLAYENGGKMQNEGYEINFNLNRLKLVGDLFSTFNFTFANNRNVIKEMDAIRLASINGTGTKKPANGYYPTMIAIDNPFGAIYGLRYKGVYAYNYDNYDKARSTGATCPVVTDEQGNVIYDAKGQPKQMYYDYNGTKYAFQGGDAIYEDVNHDGSIDEYDLVYLGSSLPKLTGGFGFRLMYKSWSLNAQFNYRYGNKIINMARINAENMYTTNNQSTAVNYRWRKEGDGINGERILPRALYGSGYNWMGSDRFVEDGSFVRLNYLQLSYGFDKKWLRHLGLSNLSVYFSADNLFIITNYSGVDPEVPYGGMGVTTDNAMTPRAKSYTLGLTVDF